MASNCEARPAGRPTVGVTRARPPWGGANMGPRPGGSSVAAPSWVGPGLGAPNRLSSPAMARSNPWKKARTWSGTDAGSRR